MNDKELQLAFLQFLAQKSGAKNQQELEKYVQSLGEDGLKQAYAEFTQLMQLQAQKAQHGAKLQYFRNLKHQCAEDEEPVYFKRGGSLDCGCKKKMETGGEVPKKKSSNKVVDDFKNRKKDQAPYKNEKGGSVKKGCGGTKVKFSKGKKIKVSC